MTRDRWRLKMTLVAGFGPASVVLLLVIMQRMSAWMFEIDPAALNVENSERLLLPALALGAAMIGALSARYHPIARPPYVHWLMTTPWRPGMVLPLGTPYLDRAGWVAIAVIEGIACKYWPTLWTWPLVGLALGYVLSCVGLLGRSKRVVPVYVLAFGLPLVLQLYEKPTALLMVAVSLFLYAMWAVRNSIRAYPWKMDEPNAPVVGALGWPLNSIAPKEPAAVVPVTKALVGSALIGWWLYTALVRIPIEESEGRGLLAIVVMLGGLVRLGIYSSRRHPPISLVGRIWTGRLILRGYDGIWITPIMAVLTAVFGPPALEQCGIDWRVALTISAGSAAAVLLALGPTRRKFDLTGWHSSGGTQSGLERRGAVAAN